MKRALVLAAVLGCAGRVRVRPSAPVCAIGTQPGTTSRALTWNGAGWGAVVSDGASLFLREFAVDGVARGERVPLVEEPSTPAKVGVAWSDGTYYVAVAPHQGTGAPRIFRVSAGRADADAFALDDQVTGELAMVPRDVSSKPAALWIEGEGRTSMRLVGRDGEPGAPRRCPEGLQPRAVTAWRDGFRGAVTVTNAATGEARAVEVVGLDDNCELAWRTRVWEGSVSTVAPSIAVDESGVVVAIEAGDDGTWVAAVDHEGRLRTRAARMERNAHAPHVFVQTDASGRRLGIQVVAVRTIETGDRLEVWRLDAEGLLRETRPVANSDRVEIRFGAADPWGGGIVGFTRSETSRGVNDAGFFARVCP